MLLQVAVVRSCRILVVDDEEDIVSAVRDVLETSLDDAHVHTASSGTEALHLLARQDIDLIVTDYRMPGMDGVEFLEEARKIRQVPHILITAFDRDLMAELGSRASRHLIVQKPLEPDALVDAVRKALGR